MKVGSEISPSFRLGVLNQTDTLRSALTNNVMNLNNYQEAFEASRMTRSKVPGAALRKRPLRLRETAMLMVGF